MIMTIFPYIYDMSRKFDFHLYLLVKVVINTCGQNHPQSFLTFKFYMMLQANNFTLREINTFSEESNYFRSVMPPF